jgi:hypothetical protein
MNAQHVSRSHQMPASSLFALYLGGIAAALVGNLGMRLAERGGWLPPSGRLALGLVAVVPLSAAAVLFWRLLRGSIDEMIQRIILEGMAFALVVYIPLAALFVNVRTAGFWTPRLDPADILLAPGVLVALGIALAWRRME